jgi:hypothetical protein
LTGGGVGGVSSSGGGGGVVHFSNIPYTINVIKVIPNFHGEKIGTFCRQM